jgi:acyl-coenzyme A thioesterase PaaI-like protein
MKAVSMPRSLSQQLAISQAAKMMRRMATLELPHSNECLVCGRTNPLGLHLHLLVDEESGEVRCHYTPRPEHVGFEGIVHGGILATVVDEAMVWAASWRGRRFCVCGELTTRFRQPVIVGQTLLFTAKVEFSRPKLIETAARITDTANALIATANGKYVPVAPEQHRRFVMTMLDEPETTAALQILRP